MSAGNVDRPQQGDEGEMPSPCSVGGAGEVDCDTVLDELFAYLDKEATTMSPDEIKRHLQGCAPCMSELDMEVALKRLVQRSCACEPAPETLRVRIVSQITRITQVTVRKV